MKGESLQLWGGIESTRNRVGDEYFDQCEQSGHNDDLSDLDRIFEIGIRTLRYPVLWDRCVTTLDGRVNWSWPDERLPYLRRLGVEPIVGLVHHGSGPAFTDLLDPGFATGLAAFAGKVARRFPWVSAYTPINEPLTTARFSALYGHWYPHRRDNYSFALALLNQCKATVLAMQAIRRVTANAQLIQTEDLGKTSSTPKLRYQADFDNMRRWVTFDLLCGHVVRGHPLAEFLIWSGISEQEVFWFLDHPCPPDILGINYYVTSDRYLDEHVDRDPSVQPGGNGRHVYVDIDAVRVPGEGITGVASVLAEAWSRYGLPVAVTEAHLGCTREEQLRWLWEVWQSANAAKKSGVDVRAVTIWSLLGSYDWDSLVTLARGHYECGAFDVRSPSRRRTALGSLAQSLCSGRPFNVPVLAQKGWWQRCRGHEAFPEAPASGGILISGASGTLGRAFVSACSERALPFHALSRTELDITDIEQVAASFARFKPWAVINAAGFARPDDAESQPQQCFWQNVHGASVLARACARSHIPMLGFSSALVFDGLQRVPYCEGDTVRPLSVYGRSKAEAEQRILGENSRALVIRSSTCFGAADPGDLLIKCLRGLAAGDEVFAAHDLVISPTYVPDLVHACLDLLIDGASGIWHLANSGEVTWAELAQSAAKRAGYNPRHVRPVAAKSLQLAAVRPSYCALGTTRGQLLPHLGDALDRYVAAIVSGCAPTGPALPQLPARHLRQFNDLQGALHGGNSQER